jgi:hypothetical protein
VLVERQIRPVRWRCGERTLEFWPVRRQRGVGVVGDIHAGRRGELAGVDEGGHDDGRHGVAQGVDHRGRTALDPSKRAERTMNDGDLDVVQAKALEATVDICTRHDWR